MESHASDEVNSGFAKSQGMFESLVATLAGSEAMGLAHGELEEQLQVRVRELLRCLSQDHLDMRAAGERPAEQAVDADEVTPELS
jgi:hypothetical protein